MYADSRTPLDQPRPTAGKREMTLLRVDPWDPEYGASTVDLLAEEGPQTIDFEIEDRPWEPVSPQLVDRLSVLRLRRRRAEDRHSVICRGRQRGGPGVGRLMGRRERMVDASTGDR